MKQILETITELYNQGLNDREIGERIGKSNTYVRHRRFDLGLKSQYHNRSSELRQKIKELTEIGLSDIQMGEILNKNHRTIGHHRTKLNLLPSMPQNSYQNEYDRIRGYMIRNVKFSGKRRNIEFNLNFNDFELPNTCPILGIDLTYRTESDGNELSHATLDRIDNSKGYIPGNVIVVSRLANSMKNQANFEQIETFCKNILTLINYYKNQGALGSITDVFPDVKLKEI